MYQNQSQNLSKIWSFEINFSSQGVILNTNKFFDMDNAWSDIFLKNIFSKCEKICLYLKMLVYDSWNWIHVQVVSFSSVFYT